jgi:hypothetical protein
MADNAPVLLVVLVETARLRWFVAAVDLGGCSTFLLRSEVGDLEKYRALDFDEQVAFLRHRFCGVLQRGCDRLWERGRKACQFIFVFDELLPEPTGHLTQAFAQHMAGWLLRPPVVVFRKAAAGGPESAPRLECLAGDLDRPLEELLLANVGALQAAREDLAAWELSPARAG